MKSNDEIKSNTMKSKHKQSEEDAGKQICNDKQLFSEIEVSSGGKSTAMRSMEDDTAKVTIYLCICIQNSSSVTNA